MKEKYVKVIFKVWSIDADWFVDEGKKTRTAYCSVRENTR